MRGSGQGDRPEFGGPPRALFCVVRLEAVLQAKLHSSGGPGTRDSAKGGRANGRAWIPQVDLVEGIEHLRPKLHAVLFGNPESFHNPQVPALESRSDHNTTPGISSELRGPNETTRVKPAARRSAAIQIAVTNAVRPRPNADISRITWRGARTSPTRLVGYAAEYRHPVFLSEKGTSSAYNH